MFERNARFCYPYKFIMLVSYAYEATPLLENYNAAGSEYPLSQIDINYNVINSNFEM